MSPRQFVWLLGTLAVAAVIAWLILRDWQDGPPNPRTSSPPITVWFSEMGAGVDSNSYLQDETKEAIGEIELSLEGLDVFDVKSGTPDEPRGGSDHRDLSVKVGCYRVEGPNGTYRQELRTAISDPNGADLPGLSKTPERLSDEPYSDQVAQQIRRCILGKYPPEGSISKLQDESEAPPDLHDSQTREVTLDVGRLAGVRAGDVFQVVPSTKERIFFRSQEIKIMRVSDTESEGLVSWDLEMKEGGRVRWKRAGY